ncbi:hypothetical protein APED_33255 [Acanthopleuribacter pedis]
MLRISPSLRWTQQLTHQLSQRRTNKAEFITTLKFPPSSRTGKLPYVYCLAPAGKRFLERDSPEESEPSLVARYPSFGVRDYEHRLLTIKAHIALSQLLEQRYPFLEIRHWDRYFVKTGRNRHRNGGKPLWAETRLELPGENRFCIPDAICELIDTRQSPPPSMLFAWEIACGADTKRNLYQLSRHLECLTTKVLAAKYRRHQAHTILLLCQERPLCSAIRRRFVECSPKASRLSSRVLLACAEDFFVDPETCWQAPIIRNQDAHFSFLTGKVTPFPTQVRGASSAEKNPPLNSQEG